MSLLDSVLKSESTGVEISVAMLKKAQDTTKQQGEAMIKMIETAGFSPDGQHLDTYA